MDEPLMVVISDFVGIEYHFLFDIDLPISFDRYPCLEWTAWRRNDKLARVGSRCLLSPRLIFAPSERNSWMELN